MATGTETQACANCKFRGSDLPDPLKRCGKCKNTWYCSQDCQRADWKAHKKTCGISNPSFIRSNATCLIRDPAQGTYTSVNPVTGHTSGPFALGTFKDPFADDALQLDTVPEQDALMRIIDAYRLRMDDELHYGGRVSGLYNNGDPLKDFQCYLHQAEVHGTCLPSWWSEAKSVACQSLAMHKAEWSDLGRKIQVDDVTEHYGDPMMATKMRIWSEKVVGGKVGARWLGDSGGSGNRGFV